MSLLPENADRQELYIVARRVLLDALTALTDQRQALIVVGAQAVYLRSKNAALGTAVYTSDGDLSIDPRLLEDDPHLEEAMSSAGFHRSNQPGTWTRDENVGQVPTRIAVDLLIPEAFSGSGSRRRSVNIPPHDGKAARKVPGLEPSLADNDLMTIGSLDANDKRSATVKVAGVAALLVAKVYKIADRLLDVKANRLADKDGGDVLRLMMTSDPEEVGQKFLDLMQLDDIGEIAGVGLRNLRAQFGRSGSPGVQMAVRALAADVPDRTIRATAQAYVAALPGDA